MKSSKSFDVKHSTKDFYRKIPMARRCAFVCAIIIVFTLLINSNDISAIKCWRCTSRSKFCGDVLDHSNLTLNQLSWYFVPCGSVRKKVDYKGDKMIAKCNLRIDLAYGKLVYSRKCVEEAETANLNDCFTDEVFNDNDDPNVQMMSCETCTEDGCNSKIQNYFITETESSDGISGFPEPKVDWCLLVVIIFSHRLYI